MLDRLASLVYSMTLVCLGSLVCLICVDSLLCSVTSISLASLAYLVNACFGYTGLFDW